MFALIKNGVVVQIQPNEEPGFVAVPAGTICGMVQNTDGTFPAPGPTLTQAQASQIALLRTFCQSAITGGFTSNALGSVNYYSSGLEWQKNIDRTSANPNGGIIRCGPTPTGAWSLTPHTQAQAVQVREDLQTWVESCLKQEDALIAQVTAATTASGVRAIVWVNP